MFTVLQIEEKTTGFFQKMRERFRPTKPFLQRVEVKSGAPFFILRLRKEKGEIPWDKVAYHAGRTAKRLVIPDGITPPEDSGISPYTPEYLPFILLFNTALKGIKKDLSEPNLRRMTVIDKRGILARHIEKAVDYVGEITIMTDNRERYEAVAEKILKDTGAVIRLVEEPDTFANYLIAEDIRNFSTQAKVYCLNHEEVKAEDIIRFENISLPPEYEELRPVSISAITFASALYEMCGVTRLEDLA